MNNRLVKALSKGFSSSATKMASDIDSEQLLSFLDRARNNPNTATGADMEKEKQVRELSKRMENVPPLPGEPDFFTSEETLTRYLKAREWNLSEAEKLLKATVEWRRENRPLDMQCKWCHDRPGTHCLRQVGFDESGRPVIYSCFAQAATHRNTVEESVAHVVYLIENAKITMKPGIHQWVFVIDCTGMTLPACSPKLGYGVTQVMSNHYPERLGLVICINHNPVFQGVWKAIKVFLHQNTVSKMRFMRSKSKIQDTFNQYFSSELSNWLLDEIKLNKQRPLPDGQKTFWMAPTERGQHDSRGCPSYVDQFVDPFLSNQGKGETRLHQPHPNIVDTLHGVVKPIDGDSVGDEDFDDDFDIIEGVDELDIGEEFQIPKDAKTIG